MYCVKSVRFGVILVHIFTHLDLIRRDTDGTGGHRARLRLFGRNNYYYMDESNEEDENEEDFENKTNDIDLPEDEQHHHFDENKPQNNPKPCKKKSILLSLQTTCQIL